MRVVVVTTSFPRDEGDPSGHFVRASARALAAGGDEVHVIAPGGAVWDRPVSLGGAGEDEGGRERAGQAAPHGAPAVRPVAPREAEAERGARRGALILHHAGGGVLFGWPGAVARAREAPWRLVGAGSFAAGVQVRLRGLGPVDRAVAHWIVPCAWPLLVRTRAELEVVAHGADVRALVRAPRLLRHHVLRALLERGARFTFAARALLRALAAALDPAVAAELEARATVAPPALDLPDVAARAAALRKELGLDVACGERLAVVACRLVTDKRVDVAIEAAWVASSPVRLVVVGDGPARAELERLAAAMADAYGGRLGAGAGAGVGARRVIFMGMLPRREALAWIGAADVLLHPSEVEAAPTVIREARALGVRVVTCDAGDVGAWAAADPGITLIERSAQAFARALDVLPCWPVGEAGRSGAMRPP
jgi:teichuronic acid biosynthesis glycosyltransferase TuaC